MAASSNSIRIGAQLFESAREQGELMSRSAAQQVEYWARLGAALEARGMSVIESAAMLRGDDGDRGGVQVTTMPEAQMWAEKRARQERDLEAVRSGKVSGQQMSWFSDGWARTAKLVDSPY